MKNQIILILSIFMLGYNLAAQNSINGIVIDSLNKPIPYASVCLAQTTIGTTADSNGKYTLIVPQEGYYQLYANNLGYKPFLKYIYINANNPELNIQLSLDYYKLNEVTIEEKGENRRKFYKLFIKEFIGKSPNATMCKVLNPKSLHVFKDYKHNILKAYSTEPIKIQNKALGYIIIYNLNDFSYDINNESIKYSGIPCFQNMEGNTLENDKWNQDRITTYYGSRMHFIRTVFSDSNQSQHFTVYDTDSLVRSYDILDSLKPLKSSDFIVSHDEISKTMFYRNPLILVFKKEIFQLKNITNSHFTDYYKSTLNFSDSATIYQNGFYTEPYSLSWSGAMVNARIADMLPYDYQPDDLNTNEIAINSILTKKVFYKEQVFAQTDRNIYLPGDTIHFQAYIKNAETGQIESCSASLYAMLFNEQKETADSSRFRINGSTSSGWMVVPEKAKSGIYHFVAFTSNMQNTNPAEAFQLDLRIADNLMPVKSSIEFNKDFYNPGDTIIALLKTSNLDYKPVRFRFENELIMGKSKIDIKDSKLDKKGESTIKFRLPDSIPGQPKLHVGLLNEEYEFIEINTSEIPLNNQAVDFRFLPEGGNLIAGLQQRVAFNATNTIGEPVQIEGVLKNSKGTTLDTIQSGTYGPGEFTCVPEVGIYVELTKGEFKDKIWPLKDIKSSGMSFCINQTGKYALTVEIQSSKYSNQSAYIYAYMNGYQIVKQEIKLDKAKRIKINTEELPAGAVQIVLYNNVMQPVAQRLVYVNAYKHLKFNISSDSAIYNPGHETELSISVTDGSGNPESGIFSIAVVHSKSGIDDKLLCPGIDYIFNYHPYFSKNLPAKVLSEGLENLDNKQRDLLMMVYGWSKINYQEIDKTENNEFANYDLLNMKIYSTRKDKLPGRSLDIVSFQGFSEKHVLTDEIGMVSFPLDSLDSDTKSIFIKPGMENKKRAFKASLNIPINQQYFKDEKLFQLQPTLLPQKHISSQADNNISVDDSIIEIPEVTIKSYFKKEYANEYEERFRSANIKTLAYEDLWSCGSMKSAIYKLITPTRITEDSVFLMPKTSLLGAYVPALFVLDGIPISYEAWAIVKSLNPYDLQSITILKGLQGNTMYGSRANGGVIFINTMYANQSTKLTTRYDAWMNRNSRSKKNKLLVPFKLYRQYKEYYNPTKSELSSNPIFQNRPTVFWKSEVYFDGKAPVKIKYPNSNLQGRVMVTINGASANNLVGTGKFGYWIQTKKIE